MDLTFILHLKDLVSGGVQRIASTTQTAFRAVDNVVNHSQRNLHAYEYKLRDVNTQLDGMRRRMNDMPRGGGMGLPGFIATAAITAGALGSIHTAAADEGVNKAVDFATIGKGAQVMSHIAKESDLLGLSYEAQAQGAKTLFGAMRGGQYTLENQVKLFDGIAEASAALHISAQDQVGSLLAVSQMASKGTVSAEELRGQLGERIPGAFKLAADAMGVTEMKLNDLLQKGLVPSAAFLPRFAEQLHKTFGVEAVNSANSATANLNRFNTEIYRLKVFLGQELLPAATRMIKEYLIPGAHWLKENWHWLKFLGGTMIAATTAVKTMAAAQAILNATMAANPVMLVVAGFGLLVTALAAAGGKMGDTGAMGGQAYAKGFTSEVDKARNVVPQFVKDPSIDTAYTEAGKKHGALYTAAMEQEFIIGSKLFGIKVSKAHAENFKTIFDQDSKGNDGAWWAGGMGKVTGFIQKVTDVLQKGYVAGPQIDVTDRIYGTGAHRVLPTGAMGRAGAVGGFTAGKPNAPSLPAWNPDSVGKSGHSATKVINIKMEAMNKSTYHIHGTKQAADDTVEHTQQGFLRLLGSLGHIDQE